MSSDEDETDQDISACLPPVLDHSQDASKFIAQCGFMYRSEADISGNLLCPICSDPWVEPLLASFCGHLFCKKCINTWIKHIPTCPVDRSLLTPSRLTQPPKILNELVGELVVVCSLGCGWEGRRDEWKVHLERYCPEQHSNVVEEVEEKKEKEKQKEVVEDTSHDEKRFRVQWKKLAREVTGLKKEAKDYLDTIEVWKDKVASLQLELKAALELGPVGHESDTQADHRHERTDSDEDGVYHRANCDFCRRHIRRTRYKCLKCPDVDACEACYAKISALHPVHDFVPIKDPDDVNIVALPEWKIKHPRITCNHCGSQVVGPRYKCTLCADYDLCHFCFALPRPPHPLAHPMTRYVHPQRQR